MARWKLLQPHYLAVAGCTWEYREQDMGKRGKQVRREFPVPMFLHPESPDDWNTRDQEGNGFVTVSNSLDPNFPNDYIFTGDPTPDMEPLDDAARELSAKFKDRWEHPIEGLPATMNYSQSLLDAAQKTAAEFQAKPQSVEVAGMTDLLATMAAMMKQNQDLIATLASQRAGTAGGDVRRA